MDIKNSDWKFNVYYNYLDEQMVEGDELAEKLISEYGYEINSDVLYNYVDKKAVEGDEKAIALIEKYGYL